MVKMSNATAGSESEEDTVTSSDCSDSSDNESSDHDKDDTSDTASYRSLAFSVRKHRSTATVKSKKTKKRVRFKPGDSLVLIYVIPNREMLGLKSDSEESDYGDSDDESDDEDDEDDEEDEDDDDNDESDDEDDDDDDEGGSKCNKNKSKKPKPFAKLLAVKQINRRRSVPDLKPNFKKAQEKQRTLNLEVNQTQNNLKKKQRSKLNRKEKTKVTKKDLIENKTKQSKVKKNKVNAIKTDIDKSRNRRNRARLLEIRATVEPSSKNNNSNVRVPKVLYKHDTKTSVIDINNSTQLTGTKPLTHRAKLQPTSIRISKPVQTSEVSKSTNSLPEKNVPVAKVMSASYDSLTSVLPTSYVTFNSIENQAVEESIKRLDPDSMNASGKRNYAWQIANGTISSQSLRTPSILPFWDSLQNTVTENNALKLPT